MAITPLTSSDTFQTWFNTTNTIISTVNGITGISGGISGPYVISFNGLSGVVTFSNYVADFNGVTGSVSGVTGIIGSSGILVSGTSTYPTITNTGVLSINTQTGAITGIATLTSPQIFTALQQFTGGISASGATFSGNISAPNVVTTTTANTFTALQQFTSGISASGGTFSGNVIFNNSITAPNIVNSYNGLTGTVTGVSTFNGLTGTVTGVSSFNGITGAVTGVSTFNGLTGTVSGVSTFNGLTGTVTGVSSFNGITGAVTGVSTFNGLTGTVSGVSTFNGLTGAVTGVTTTTANTFTALQTFNAGITASSIYVTNGVTLAAPEITFGGTTLSIRTDNVVVGNATTDIITLPSTQVIRTLVTNTAGTSAISILEYPVTSYSSAEFLIQGERYTTLGGTIGTQTVKILMSATCGSSTYTVSHVEYGNVTNGSTVATYTVDINGSSWRLRVTPTSSNTMRFRTVAILYPNVGGVGSAV
jgi:hypothetical protein